MARYGVEHPDYVETQRKQQLGYIALHREKRRLQSLTYRHANLEERRKKDREFHNASRDKRRKRDRARYNADIVQARQRVSEYRTLHPEKVHQQAIVRRIRRKHGTPPNACAKAMAELYRTARKSNKHVDHIVPLRCFTMEGYPVSGLHCEWNMQLLTPLENLNKGNRMRPEDHLIVECC
jgi:hypothetical protein